MASKNEIVEALNLMASMAFTIAEDSLAESINEVIVKHGGTPAAAPAPAAPAVAPPVADEEFEDDEIIVEPAEEEDVAVAAVLNPGHDLGDLGDDELAAELAAMVADTFGPGAAAGDDADPDADHGLAALAAQINEVGEDAVRAATPRSMTLVITTADGPAADADLATEVAAGVLGSIIEVVGEVTVGDIVVGEDATTVVLDLADDNDGVALAQMSGQIGLPVFEADWPVDEVTYRVSAVAAEVADLDLARDLGYAAPEDFEMPAVPEGQHPINGVLDLAEEALGFRPEAASLLVTYRREGGAREVYPELTVEQVNRIVAHPISQGGLRRLGNLALLEVADGETPASKVASFGILDAGEINPAVLAVGAAAYRGTFDFGGDIGVVTANAEAVPVDAHVEV